MWTFYYILEVGLCILSESKTIFFFNCAEKDVAGLLDYLLRKFFAKLGIMY